MIIDKASMLLLKRMISGTTTNIVTNQICNYKHDSRKCTEAGINSRITVPSKVCASQDTTKT